MTFGKIYEFSSLVVIAPGEPNEERIVFRPTELVDLTCFGMWICAQREDESVVPLTNHFYWFGRRSVAPPSWICLFTGQGEYRELAHRETGVPVYCFHWGYAETIFTHRQIVPVLFRFDNFNIGEHSVELPSLQPTPEAKQISDKSKPETAS